MFNLLRFGLTVLICVLVVGFFLGWFSFSRSPTDPQTNKMNISVSVDRTKVGTDLQRFEQKVSKGISDLKDPQAGTQAGPQNAKPGLSLGPINIQPNGQYGQPAPQQGTGFSFGPINVQPSQQPAPPSYGQPQLQLQTPDYQFTLPVTVPPGEGR